MRAVIVRLIGGIGVVIEWITILLTGALVLVVSANVVARYFLRIPMTWAEETSLLLFVWMVFLGAFVALRRKLHLAITFVTKRLPPGGRRIQRVAVIVLVLSFLAVLTAGGLTLVLRTFALGRVTSILGISAAWGYLSVPVASFCMLLEAVKVILEKEQLLEYQQPEAV